MNPSISLNSTDVKIRVKINAIKKELLNSFLRNRDALICQHRHNLSASIIRAYI